MTSERIVIISASILSLLFLYVPTLKLWFEKKTVDQKRVFMLVWLFVVAGGIYMAACVPEIALRFGITLACDAKTAWDLVFMVVNAVIANQTTYLIAPSPESIRRMLGKLTGRTMDAG